MYEYNIFMLSEKFMRIYTVHLSILLFLILFIGIHMVKPGFIYNKEGGFRPFGVGYKHKTVLPMWLMAITLGILSYLIVCQMQ